MSRTPFWRKPHGRRYHRLRTRVRSRRTTYELSWECVERRASTGAVAWESPIGGRIVRVAKGSYMWRPPDGGVAFDLPSKRAAIEAAKRYATPEQLRELALGEAMKERSIIMAARASVRGTLAGNKTQTRRIIKHPGIGSATHVSWNDHFIEGTPRFSSADAGWDITGDGVLLGSLSCPYGVPGDRLWVREKWQAIHVSVDPETGHGDDVFYAKKIPASSCDGYWGVTYAATDPGADESTEDRGFPWRSPIFMPRWAARILLEVVDVSAERLQDITPEDIVAEGMLGVMCNRIGPDFGKELGSRKEFAQAWDALNGKRGYGWDKNPWVWKITFRRLEP